MDDGSKKFERRYHASWLRMRGLSPLAKLGEWMCAHPHQLAEAPRLLLVEAACDVVTRLPQIAAREPTRRHRKHFAWLFNWHVQIMDVLERGA